MRLFSRFSIRTKLALVMTAILALISVAIFVYLPARLERQANMALTQKAAALGEMSAVTLAPALDEHDQSEVAAALTAVRRNPDLVFLVVEDDKGQRFTSFSDLIADDSDYANIHMHSITEGPFSYPRANPEGGSRETYLRDTQGGFTRGGDIFVTKTPVRWLGKLVGTLYLGFTTQRVREDIARSQATIAGLTLVAFVVGVALVFALSTVVTGPLSRIAATTQRIAEGELDQRADVKSDDEVGRLARSFNLMIDRIAAEQWELESLNTDLEKRVDERTREVTEQFEERKRAEERYRLLFDRNLAGVYIASPDFRVISCNNACAQIFGYSSTEEFLEQLGSIAYAYDRDRDAILRRLHSDRIVTNEEVELRGRDGRSVWALENVRLIESASGATLEGILLDVSDRKRAEEEIAYRAYHDPLTDLPNRALFLDRLTVAIAHAERQQRRLAVLFLDVDDLKMVNDTLGHATGDELLMRLAKRLGEMVRRGDTVARVGGDEFLILLPDLHGEQDAAAIAQKILDRLTTPFVVNGEELHVTTSIGVSVYPTDGADAETLIRNADGAMYRVKERGGNKYQLSSRLVNRALGRMSLEQELRNAIDRDEFVVYYQPQVSLTTGIISGVEALVRWQTADDSLVEPGAFIPIAEHTGLIGQIGAAVLRKSCEQYASWQKQGFELPRIGINVSARQFFQPDFTGSLERTINESCVSPSFIELEITESVAMQKTEHGIRMLRRLRDLGITIAIDDFGTGQASFSYLKRFPVDTVKIDRSFVREISEKASDKSIVMAILLIARELGLRTVAEGVEKPDQRDFLRSHGCDAIQGYIISRPVPAVTFEALFLKPGPARIDVAAIAGVTSAVPEA
ncbi:MAG TPA: EAL domain-containing protein [Thermoanaerobaculia bacterium]